MQAPAAIEARELSVVFNGATLFDGLSFLVSPGEHVALTGPSGCGKTTVLRCLLGFSEPAAGEIVVQGEALSPHSVWNIRSQLAFVPQEAELGEGTVREFIDRPFQYRANSAVPDYGERLPLLFDAVGLDTALLSSSITSLSGGEKQRIALVSALLLDRPILLLDEVTSALDKENRARVNALLSGLSDTTVVGVVHEGAGMPFATRQIAVVGGRA
jgi:putative ABC transport system ATP-binding protein